MDAMTDIAWRLDGVALVTGASSGIGRALATALARAGCRVILAGRRRDVLDGIAAELGGNALAFPLDVTDTAAVSGLPASLPAEFAAVDILVNNAGHDVGGRTRFDTSTADELASVIETNLTGPMRLARALIPAMAERGRGDVVNIGSVNTLRTTPGLAAYSASKHGLHGLTQVLRADYAALGIRVIEIVPGLTRTEFARIRFRGDAEKAEAHFNRSPVQLQPGEVADAALYALTRPRHINISQMIVTPSTHW
jgi:3-hydroxy acid dehydrogenase / malonic semialdehyde reductase